MDAERLLQKRTRLRIVAALVLDHTQVAKRCTGAAQIADLTADFQRSCVMMLRAYPILSPIVKDAERTQRIGFGLGPAGGARQRQRTLELDPGFGVLRLIEEGNDPYKWASAAGRAAPTPPARDAARTA